ncbi:hypothetical protein D7S86_06830 [Pararobbsia silviterrae]|uniref:Uncharacterized protein n=2 Tax=Pararobbsia silviterrae TaxID=1792498 RepID=A0A494Y5U3_9BURK|nr:hypothetical protein D7S86_06830 [Pararobbsia silviterrae]
MVLHLALLAAVIAFFASIVYINLRVHIATMRTRVNQDPFPLQGATRQQALAKIEQWEAQRKKLGPIAVSLIGAAIGLAMLFPSAFR